MPKKKKCSHHWEYDGDGCHQCGAFIKWCKRCGQLAYCDDKGKIIEREDVT